MIDTLRAEIAYRLAYAKAYPWLGKVQRLPGAGLWDACGCWHGLVAANDAGTDRAQAEPDGAPDGG